ncbi:MAG TPA: tetratricopeptide repeat protein, partial [Acidobacteriota bacterium]
MKLLIIIVAFLAIAQSQTTTSTSSRINQEEQAIIDEGTALFEQGKYDEAIVKYKQILDKHPNNLPVLSKMASIYFAAAKYDDAVKIATQGSAIESDYQPQLFMILGNSFEKLGNTEEAISTFKKAVEALPNNALLHFNLAALLSNTGAFDDARSHLKTAVQLDPKHASTHFALGQIYYKQEYLYPSTLALFRFLTLEPNTQRSQKALSMLDQNFKLESTATTAPKDEGDFSNYESILSSIQKSKTKPARVEIIDRLFTAMSEGNQKGNFVLDYYFPYFVELKKNGLIAPFTYYIYQSADPEASQWVK